MTKEMLDKIVDDKEFSDCIADAVPLRVKVINDLQPEMKEIKEEYETAMMQADWLGVSNIMQKLKLDKKDENAKLELKEWKKKIGRTFKAALKCLIGFDEDKTYIGALYNAGKILTYIGRDDVVQKTVKSDDDYDGIKFKGLDQLNPAFAPDDVREKMKQLFKDAVDVQKRIDDCAAKIKVDIYERLPAAVRYDKDQNPSGLKSGNFGSLVKTKTVGVLKDKEKYTKYIEAQIKNSGDNRDREEIMTAKMERL